MIKRKIFYSVIQIDGITGIRKQDGYELQIDGKKFNAYYSMIYRRAYILDDKNGIALQIYDVGWNEDELDELEIIEKAKEKFIQGENFRIWKEKRYNKSYRLTVKMFKAYKRAEKLREKQIQERRKVQAMK